MRVWKLETLTPLRSPGRNCFLRPLSLLAESEAYLKVAEIKAGIFRVLCLAAKGHGQMFSTFSSSLPAFLSLLSEAKLRTPY